MGGQSRIKMGVTTQPLSPGAQMEDCHMLAANATPSALDLLVARMRQLEAGDVVDDFAVFEDEFHKLVAAVERDGVGLALEALDVDARAIRVGDELLRRSVRCEGVYESRAGEVRVMRSLYRQKPEDASVSPMELRAGIVQGRWTPGAASLAVWAVAHVTPTEAAEWFRRAGGMAPSRASLDRLPKALHADWEEQRTRFEECVRAVEEVPEAATVVAVSLDGVMLAMKDGDRQGKREASRTAGKETRGPAGYREAACGTLAFYDAAGERLQTIVLGRMPEATKRTLKQTLEDELQHVLDQRPNLTVVGVADGAHDNWAWLADTLPAGSSQVVDFFHAAAHLEVALQSAHGKASPQTKALFRTFRKKLLDDPNGVDKVIRALAYRHRKHPRRKAIARELSYFRRYRERMCYAEMRAKNLPVGSGVVEAANKTLVTVRMKRAGARWRNPGGQAVLTFRALAKSDRFDRAWGLLAAIYRLPVAECSADVQPVAA